MLVHLNTGEIQLSEGTLKHTSRAAAHRFASLFAIKFHQDDLVSTPS